MGNKPNKPDGYVSDYSRFELDIQDQPLLRGVKTEPNMPTKKASYWPTPMKGRAGPKGGPTKRSRADSLLRKF
jgi:hypothetical protein